VVTVAGVEEVLVLGVVVVGLAEVGALVEMEEVDDADEDGVLVKMLNDDEVLIEDFGESVLVEDAGVDDEDDKGAEEDAAIEDEDATIDEDDDTVLGTIVEDVAESREDDIADDTADDDAGADEEESDVLCTDTDDVVGREEDDGVLGKVAVLEGGVGILDIGVDVEDAEVDTVVDDGVVDDEGGVFDAIVDEGVSLDDNEDGGGVDV